MSTQTFSKVFIFPNNKRKTENIFPITTGPAHENDRPTVAFGLSNRAEGKERRPGSGIRPKTDMAQQRAEGRQPRHASVPGAMAARQLPAGRRPRPGKKEHTLGPREDGEHEKVTQGDREGTGKPFPRRGQVRRRHDRRRRNRSRWLYLAQTVTLQRAPGVGERGRVMCARVWVTVDHRRPISPAELRWRGRREQSSVRGEGEMQRGRGKMGNAGRSGAAGA